MKKSICIRLRATLIYYISCSDFLYNLRGFTPRFFMRSRRRIRVNDTRRARKSDIAFMTPNLPPAPQLTTTPRSGE